MTERIGNALEMFNEGFNCSQSVFTSYAEEFGLETETALKIASPFGGGMGRMGEVCGAVSGALMVIGLKHGNIDPKDKTAKEEVYEKVYALISSFESRNGTILCRELIDCDMRDDPTALQNARERGVFKERCPIFVQDSLELLAKYIAD